MKGNVRIILFAYFCYVYDCTQNEKKYIGGSKEAQGG